MPFATMPDTMAGGPSTLVVAISDDRRACALTKREQREYRGLPHAARQRDWLAGRIAAKRAIGARWALSADAIELMSTPGAAPRPGVRRRTGAWSPLPDRLTIAHRDGVAIAAAFPSTASVGVDLERAAAVSPRERRYIASESEGIDDIDATLVWTLKEAAWKALGLPPTVPLSSLRLVFRAGTETLIAVRHGTRETKARAEIGRVEAGRPLIATLVVIATEVS